MVDLRFIDMLGILAALHGPGPRAERGRLRRRLWFRRLVGARLEDHQRLGHARDPRRGHRQGRSVHGGPDAGVARQRGRHRSRAADYERCPGRWPLAPRSTCDRPASPTPASSAPRRSSSSSMTSATRAPRSAAPTRSTPTWPTGTPAARSSPTSPTRSATRAATSRCRPTDAHHDLRTEMVLALEELGIVVERQHMEVATGGQAEIDIRYDSLLEPGRQAHLVQVRDQERRAPRWQDGHLHAQAAVR